MKDCRLLFFLIKVITSAIVFDTLQSRIKTEGIKSGMLDNQVQESGFDSSESEVFNNNSLNNGGALNSSEDINSLNMVYIYGYDGNLANISQDKYDFGKEQMFKLSNNKLLNIRKEIINDAWNDIINFKNKIKPDESRFKYDMGTGNRSREGRFQSLINYENKFRRPFTFVRIEKRRILDYSFVSGEIKDESTRAIHEDHHLPTENDATSQEMDGGILSLRQATRDKRNTKLNQTLTKDSCKTANIRNETINN